MSLKKQLETTAANGAGNPRRRRGVILLMACFCMPVLIGMMGLGIDVAIIYAIKARLQMACDGAAVSALRSLSLAQTTASQVTQATTVANQWFSANFAGNYLGAYNTSTPTVTVTDNNTTRIRTVDVTATTNAPTYFMKLWGLNFTNVGALGEASRRDVAIMLVLDRSGSMNNTNNSYNGQTPCQVMVTAAKQFTGMFQQNRDQIGLVTFAEAVQVTSSPTTTFQTSLGYSNAGGSGTGLLDNITCVGGTNTSTALALAWNELYKLQTPGVLNAIVLMTDGVPTAGTHRFVTTAAQDPTGVATSAVKSTSGCWDSTGKALNAGGNMVNNPRNWILSGQEANSGSTVSLGTNSYFGPFSGPIGSLYGDGSGLYGIAHFFDPGTNTSTYENSNTFPKSTSSSSSEAPGCGWGSGYGNPTTDIAFVPPYDLFGNSISGYVTSGITTSSISGATRVTVDTNSVSAVNYNLTDNMANFARNSHTYTNAVTMPGTLIFTIGLGGNGGVDFTLLQRVANDPNADPNGNYGAYTGYNTSQPVGTFVYSSDSSTLSAAFAKIADVILRISK